MMRWVQGKILILPYFNVMTKAELRSYVLSHREDQDAFQALADNCSLEYDGLVRSMIQIDFQSN
jgi:hypothetical protein